MICGAVAADVTFQTEALRWLHSNLELDCKHKRRRRYLWFRDQFKPKLSYRLVYSNAQLQHQPGIPQRSLYIECSEHQRNEIEDLCAKGQVEKAVDLLFQLDRQGSVPSVNVYGSLLKACIKRKALPQAKRVHAHLVNHELDSNRFLGETVVSTFVKCGGLQDALQVFNRLPHRTVFTWTALISGCVTAGHSLKALRMYHTMRDEGLEPDKYTFVSLLKACGSIPDIEEGRRIHAEVLTSRYGPDLFIGTSLVDMYARCGSIVDAQNVFDGLLQRDVVTWNVMIAAHALHGQAEKALQLYGLMLEEGASPDDRTYVGTLQACGILAEREEEVLLDGQWIKPKSVEHGKTMHVEAWVRGYCSDVFVGSTLISMYGKCGSAMDAEIVFHGLSHRNVVSWNAVISSCTSGDQPGKALEFYDLMSKEGGRPDERTFATVLQACGLCAENEDDGNVEEHLAKVESLSKGKAVHAQAWKQGHMSDFFVGSALVGMYGKCRSIIDAQNVFNGLSHRDVVCWTTMVAAYLEQGQAAKSLRLYLEMLDEGLSPNDRTFVSVLQACGVLAEEEEDAHLDGHLMKMKSLETVKAIHAQTSRKGYAMDIFVGNTLVSVYGKCGSIVDAQDVFCRFPFRDVVSYNAMLAAYTSFGQAAEALQLYRQMQAQGMSADEVTFVCILQACCNAGSLDICTEIHQDLMSTGSNLSPLLANNLIHTYAKCASMELAQDVFNAQIQPNVVSWTTLIAGYARQGDWGRGLRCYEKMQEAGVKPNGITFLSLLCACSHAALVNKGVEYFNSMTVDFGITPEIEHYVSLVDLLGRAGHFTWIQDLLFTMPKQPNLSLWLCLLGACRKHGNVLLAEHAFSCAIRLQPMHAAAYVLMSNIYAHVCMWSHARQVNALEQETGTWKKPGHCWIQCDQKLHQFVVADTKHPQVEQLHDLLWQVNSGLIGQGTKSSLNSLDSNK